MEKESNLKTRDIFYGIVAIATLIVAIIGASLAYFSISASSKQGAVNAQSAKVTINYIDGQQVVLGADKLIPADFNDVVKYAYGLVMEDNAPTDNPEKKCLDSNQREVCSIYRFSVSDEYAESEITATLSPEKNEFKDFAYAVYDVTNSNWVKIEGGSEYKRLTDTCSNDDNELNDCYTGTGETKQYNHKYSIFGYDQDSNYNKVKLNSTPHVYDLVVFLENKDTSQNYDQGKVFSGTVQVDISEGTGNIQGYIDPNLKN